MKTAAATYRKAVHKPIASTGSQPASSPKSEKIHEKFRTLAAKLDVRRSGVISLRGLDVLTQQLGNKEREPVLSFLKAYAFQTKKSSISLSLFLSNIKKAYDSNQFAIKSLVEEVVKDDNERRKLINMGNRLSVPEKKTEEAACRVPPVNSEEKKPIRQRIEEQKRRLKMLEDQKYAKYKRKSSPGKTPCSCTAAKSDKKVSSAFGCIVAKTCAHKMRKANTVSFVNWNNNGNNKIRAHVQSRTDVCRPMDELPKKLIKPELSPKKTPIRKSAKGQKRCKSADTTTRYKRCHTLTESTRITSDASKPQSIQPSNPLSAEQFRRNPGKMAVCHSPTLPLQPITEGKYMGHVLSIGGPTVSDFAKNQLPTIPDLGDIAAIDDPSEVDPQAWLNNSELQNIINAFDRIGENVGLTRLDPWKNGGYTTCKDNLFDINSSKRLNKLLLHGYTYKHQEKKHYNATVMASQLRKGCYTSKNSHRDRNMKFNNKSLSPSWSWEEVRDSSPPRTKDWRNEQNFQRDFNFCGIRSLYTTEKLVELQRLHQLYATQKRTRSELGYSKQVFAQHF